MVFKRFQCRVLNKVNLLNIDLLYLNKCYFYLETDFQKGEDRSTWPREAILELIDQYKSHQELFKSTTMKKAKVWTLIQQKLQESGFRYSGSQCESKFKYLKARYIKKKENVGTQGTGQSPLKFDYFHEFDNIFGKKANVIPPILAGSLRPEEAGPSKRRNEGNFYK